MGLPTPPHVPLHREQPDPKLPSVPHLTPVRITVGDMLGWLEVGMTHEEILSDYPELTEDDIRACLA